MKIYYDISKRAENIKERFEKQKNCKLCPIDDSLIHGKEYHYLLGWGGEGEKKVNCVLAYCNKKLYYLEQGYVFESNDDGTDARILIKISDYFKTDFVNTIYFAKIFLEVNSTGIYLQHFERKFTVLQFTLEGKYVKKLEIRGNIAQPYIYGSRLYYVHIKGVGKEAACYIDIEREIPIQMLEASKILELYGDMNKVVMKARYQKLKTNGEIIETGWYLYDLISKECVCLTSENGQPHRTIKNPDEYVVCGDKYTQGKPHLEIRLVDLARNMMWVAIPFKERAENGVKTQEYWEAYELKIEGEPIENAPIWRITPSQLSPGTFEYNIKDATYFDGNNFLNGRALTSMRSYDIEGNVVEYATRTNSGACNKFRVLNGYVYSDFEQGGFEQYSIENGVMEYVRDCWFAREHVSMNKAMPPLDISEYIIEYEGRRK